LNSQNHYDLIDRGLSSIEHSDVMGHMPKLRESTVLTVPLWNDAMTPRYIELSLVYFVLLFALWNGSFRAVDQRKLAELTGRVMQLVPPKFCPEP
jgi:hypothetical protein